MIYSINHNFMAQKKIRMKDYRQAQIVRLDIIAQLYKRGYSYRKIREEVMTRLNLKAYSLRTVSKDVNQLLEEWRSTRIENFDHSVQLELARIDELIKEAWQAWDKSKEDYVQKSSKQKGTPSAKEEGDEDEKPEVLTISMEQSAREINQCGDPRFLDMIHKLLVERRKLLGLYSPEKREITGDLSFASLLMTTGTVEDAE